MARAEIAGLRAGDPHFMAYVGPPSQYDLMSATQFALLTAMGLRAEHKLLDVGCGSLRAGRLLIPYLDEGNYFGIEPNEWLVEAGIAENLGSSITKVKKPSFVHNENFDASEFQTDFDFVLAQSILSHTGRELAVTALRAIEPVLAPSGVGYITFCDRGRFAPREDPPAEGWVYPGVVLFRESEVKAIAAEAGLRATRLSWYHPRQVWYALARSDELLPARSARRQRGYMASWPKLESETLKGRLRRQVHDVKSRLRRGQTG